MKPKLPFRPEHVRADASSLFRGYFLRLHYTQPLSPLVVCALHVSGVYGCLDFDKTSSLMSAFLVRLIVGTLPRPRRLYSDNIMFIKSSTI